MTTSDSPTRAIGYGKMLAAVGERSAELGNAELCLFRTTIGSKWSRELLVCGRAVNGWEPRWVPAGVNTEQLRSRLLSEIAAHDGESCPMEWIVDRWNAPTGYNTARSAFWRVIRAIAHSLQPEQTEQLSWSSQLAWTNLYHVAPAVTGNPSEKLMRLQLGLCQEQLARDVEELQPKRVLFLTGWDWAAPFLTGVTFVRKTPGSLVEACGQLALRDGVRTSVVVAKHPQGKPHTQFVEEVVEAFAVVA